MRTVKLITCNESFQARLIKGALENEGIAVAIHNEIHQVYCVECLSASLE